MTLTIISTKIDICTNEKASHLYRYWLSNLEWKITTLSLMPPNMIAMGNIDPSGEFKNGTPESIRKETLELMSKCGKYDNFVISSGCDIPPLSRWENIDAFFKAVKDIA